ncbi:MAG: hypothetical protein AAGA96_04330 [Verrucomicrobiota bacterium]
MKPLYLIDGISPFFRGYSRFKINWSKLPWNRLDALTPEEWEPFFSQLRVDLETFVKKAKETGYTAITLDDVAHLALHPAYEREVRETIEAYRSEFRQLFSLIQDQELDVYITMDVLSLTPGLKDYLGGKEGKPLTENTVNKFIVELFDQFFIDFPEVNGLILRIGESDGLDIKETFRSVLHLRSPIMVNTCLKAVLPVFEKHRRTCIFRTWTVGAHQVGDLIWRDSTLKRAVAGIESESLVLSMKFGETDFFRHLPLNRNFFLTNLPTIVELQCRREYEGCGEYPCFVGKDYQDYANELRQAPNFVGISVWCQTGGWTPFRRLAFLEDEAIWTDINSWVTLRLFRYGDSVESAITSFPKCLPEHEFAWIELLRLSEEVIKELLYIEEFAKHTLYFRRIRVPPLLGATWYNLFITDAIRSTLGHFIDDSESSIRIGYAALSKIARMKELAEECDLPVADVQYMEDSFAIIALGREYLLGDGKDEAIQKKLKKAKKNYKKKYPRNSRFRYAVKLDFKPFPVDAKHIAWFFRYFVRGERRYRLVDRLFLTHFLSLSWWFLQKTRPKAIPKFVRKSAMGIETIFK